MEAKCPQAASTFSAGRALESCALQGAHWNFLGTCPHVEDLEWRRCPRESVRQRSHRTFRCRCLRLRPVGRFCPSALPSLDREVGSGFVSLAAGLPPGLGASGRESRSSLASEGLWDCGSRSDVVP